MAFTDVREVGAVADGSARHDGEPGAIPDGSQALPPPQDPAFPAARYLPSAEHNDLRPRPGDDVTFAMPVFSESGLNFRIDEDGALWALGAWFTPRLNGAPVWRMLSGVDRTGRIFFEARKEGSVAVNAFLARREGVYAVVTASTDARIEGVAVPWLQGVAPGLDRFMVAFDRVGAVRWMRRVGGGVGAALASRGDEIALIVGVHAGEGRGSDGTGLVPTSRGAEVIEVDLSTAGTTLRTRRLPAITDSPGPSAAVFHGDGRLTALNAWGVGPSAWTWGADGRLVGSVARVGSHALAPNGQVAVHGVRRSDGECGTTEVNSAPDGETETSCALVFVDGALVQSVSPLAYSRDDWRPRTRDGAALSAFATPQAFLFRTWTYREQIPWPQCATEGVINYWPATQVLRGGHAVTVPTHSGSTAIIGPGGGRMCEYRSNASPGRSSRDLVPVGMLWCAPSGRTMAFVEAEPRCAGRVTNLETDDENCGACGRACGASPDGVAEVCRRGVCVAVGCVPTRADCDGTRANGCEVDLARAAAHCGVCGNACAAPARCVDGRCCDGGTCAGPYPSDEREGVFAPQRDVTLTSGRHDFTTLHVPEGVTVRVAAGGVLDLRVSGSARIDGTLDLRGGPGDPDCRGDGGGTAGVRGGPGDGAGCRDRYGMGPAGGASLRQQEVPRLSVTCWSVPCEERVPSGPWPIAYEGDDPAYCMGCPTDHCAGPSHQDTGADGGSIGAAAILDLAVQTTFQPGSGGGEHDVFGSNAHSTGGGAGGALRVASLTSIELGPRALILADGAPGGRAVGGGRGGSGSGGVIVLSAPSVRVPPTAEVSANGREGRGVGRIRVAVDPARCSLEGTFRPPLATGCVAGDPARAQGQTLVTRWPY